MFKSTVPDPAVFQDETRILEQVRSWMNSRSYAPASAFERLVHSVGRADKMTLRRYELQKALTANGVPLTFPEIDYLFDVLTGFKGLPTTMLGAK